MEFELLISMIAWFSGAFICGLCGLGSVIIAMPIMMFVVPAQKVILICCLTALVQTGVMAFFYHKHCPWKTVLWIIIGAIPGSIIGLSILENVSHAILEIIIGCMLIFSILGMQKLQDKFKLEEKIKFSLITGFLAGIIGTCITIDGPIIALYGLLISLNPVEFLGFTSVSFFLRNSVSDIMQALSGLYTRDIIIYSLFCIPCALCGFLLSIPLIKKIHISTFRSIVKIIILISGLICLARGFLSI